MQSLLAPLLRGVMLVAALECSAAEVVMPDCVGIRPGMPVAEARQRLKVYDAKLEVRDIEIQIPSLSEKPVVEMLFVVRKPMPGPNTNEPAPAGSVTRPRLPLPPRPPPAGEPVETLQAEITLPPNKPVVWKVVRSLRFGPGEEQTRTALFTALAEKYGKESLTIDNGFGSISRYWVQGPQGNLMEGPAAQECATFCQSYQASSMNSVLPLAMMMAGHNLNIRQVATANYMSSIQQLSMVPQTGQQCQTMSCVIAELSVTANRELVNHMQITILDAGLDTRSREATLALIKQSETAAEKQRVERARQQPIPKL